MVKLLVKKQLLEIFRGYFYDAKKNKPRSKGATAALIVMYVVLMVGVIGGMFTSLALGLCQPLCRAGLDWLYFTLFALAGLFMGVFGSVFNTFSGLYQAKDNDLLLSLPIPVRAILASRLLGVYLMGLMFSAVILLPCVVVYWVEGTLSAATAAGGIALVLAVSLLTLLLSCLLGWVVAKIHSRLKRKSLITVLSALVFFAVYYTVSLRANRLIQELLLHLDEVGTALHSGAYPLYLLGRMAVGDWLAMAVVLAVTLLLCLLMYRVLDRTFISIATASGGTVKAVYREKVLKSSSAASALLRRELGRFTSSPNYMLNCGLSSVVLPALGVLLLVKHGTVLPLLEKVFGDEASGAVTALLCAALCLIGSMNDMSASSVSLEGKNLWLAQSLPVTPWQVLRAKLLVQVLILGYGVPQLVRAITGMQFNWEPLILVGFIACGVNSSAYMAEIIRSGLQAVDIGQTEAARSLGLNSRQTMRYVIVPQAFKIIVPALGNEFVTLIKETSILSMVGIVEVTRRGTLWASQSFQSFPAYIGVAVVYLIMTLTLSRLVSYMERRMAQSDRG